MMQKQAGERVKIGIWYNIQRTLRFGGSRIKQLGYALLDTVFMSTTISKWKVLACE